MESLTDEERAFYGVPPLQPGPDIDSSSFTTDQSGDGDGDGGNDGLPTDDEAIGPVVLQGADPAENQLTTDDLVVHSVREIDFVLGKPETAVPGTRITEEEAIDIIRDGGDVIAADEATARAIAEAAGSGTPIRENPHGPGERAHYHPTDEKGKRIRSHGHVLF